MVQWTPSVSDVLKTLLHQLEKRYDRGRAAIKRKMGWIAPPTLLPYRGFGNSEKLLVMGRVLEDKPLRQPQEADTWWTNAKGMYRRFATDEFEGVRVRVRYQDQSQETVTDEEGYFHFELKPAQPIDVSKRWHHAETELLDQVCPQQGHVRAAASVLVPSVDSHFGVISDIDDTIIKSNATDFMKLARLTVFKNVHTRSALPGVGRFYRALEAGGDGQAENPFFYVSSSAWNLYDVFCDFLGLHNIPAGVILLRDLGIDDDRFIKSGHAHKLEKIERILQTCEPLTFVLIGDAGQDDPLIYREVTRRFPGRVRAIYIRTVESQRRNERTRELAEETSNLGTPMLLVEDVDQAMRHAAEMGLIRHDV